MKQVQLKIFEFSLPEDGKNKGDNLEIKYITDVLSQTQKLNEKIEHIITSKLNFIRGRFWLKLNETYETILQALWEYQKSLLPDNYGLCERAMLNSKMEENAIYHINNEHVKCHFYNPETRIIIITDFESE